VAYINDVLDRNWAQIKEIHPENILNVGIGEKFVNGVNTHEPSITVYVRKKLELAALSKKNVIPAGVENVPTNVIEFAPTTWIADKTSVSELHPVEQQHRMGAILVKPKLMATTTPVAPLKSFESNLYYLASPIQDQGNCGYCLPFDFVAAWEGVIRVLENNPQDPIKLSERHLGSCSGTTCDMGNYADTVANQCLKGVCLESCLPYIDQDTKCGAGICANWWLTAKKLASWKGITDINAMKILLQTQPLASTMEVPQSFMNYAGGVYKRLGATDPIVGGHGVSSWGGSNTGNYWRFRNQWGKLWGIAGNFLIAYGECAIDDMMYQLVPSNEPVPAPVTPVPVKKKCSLAWLLGKNTCPA
jgi:hypothetical protein